MIVGVLAHFESQLEAYQTSLKSIEEHHAFEVGEPHETKVPLVMETDGPGGSHELTDWLLTLPGVVHVDVTYVHLDEVIENNKEDFRDE